MKKIVNSQYFIIFCIMAMICALIAFVAVDRKKPESVSYVAFNGYVQANEIEGASITSKYIDFTLKDGRELRTDNPQTDDIRERILLSGARLHDSSAAEGKSGFVYGAIAALAVGGVWVLTKNKKTKTGVLPTTVGHEVKESRYDFSMVAGQDEAIKGLFDIVSFIKEPKSFLEMGARMPRGVLLYGPPGTGKTLMARALAGEAGVPFVNASGSDFVQMYVGVGAKRVRELFAKAREKKKCVIFIDEIDAIGKRRSDGNDSERDQTLNALLTEMSGFSQNEGIVVLAATNRIDTLDSALLRPGRFDRQIEIGMPDLNAREKILAVLFREKPIDADMSVQQLALQTTGFSGAALESMLNEAAIYALRDGRKSISRDDIQRAYIAVLAGEDKENGFMDARDRQICAVHEAGHAVAAIKLLPEEKIKRISIIPSTKGAGGYVLRNPSERMATKDLIQRYVILAYAGRAAEEVLSGAEQISRGASNDIEKATEMIVLLAARYGMDEECGVLCYDRQDNVVASAKRRISSQLYEATKSLVKENLGLVETIRDMLLEKESISGDDVDGLYNLS